MANFTDIAFMNPIKWYKNTATPGIHLDDDFAVNQIKVFQYKVCYAQKWQYGDATPLQVVSTVAPSPIKIYTSAGKEVIGATFPWTLVGTSGTLGVNLFECNINFDAITAGFYHLYFEANLLSYSAKFVSEKIHVSAFHKNTMLFSYRNSKNILGVYFNTGVTFNFRCESALLDYQPEMEGKDYVDQIFNTTILSATPYDTFKLFVGEAPGVPNYIVKILNHIFSCDYVNIRRDLNDPGLAYVKPVGEKWEATRVKGFPQFGWATTVQPAVNQSGIQFNDDGNPLTPGIVTAYNIGTDLFSLEPVEIVHITDKTLI